jgi:hypothetical protein
MGEIFREQRKDLETRETNRSKNLKGDFLKDLVIGEILLLGRAIAQAVSRRLPTTAAQVQTRVWSCGIL